MQYKPGDSLVKKLVANLQNGENPHAYVIDNIDKSKNLYWVKNLQTQQTEMLSKENIDLFYTFIEHTR